MKRSLRAIAASLGLAASLSLGSAQAFEFKWMNLTSRAESTAKLTSVASSYGGEACDDCNTVGACDACGNGCGDSCCDSGCASGCNDGCCDPGLIIVGGLGLDSYRGLTDGTFPGNFGVVNGVNAGAALPGLAQWGIGTQAGVSYGLYDLQGRIAGGENARSQEQLFITTGFFRRAQGGSPVVLGIAYDWMINDNFGVFSREPFLGQWRGQIGWVFSPRNEIGWWGAFHDRRDQQGGVAFRGVSQQNLYWHHNFVGGSDSWLYVGIPERNRLTGAGSLGEWVLGGALTVPITARVGTYMNFAYMCPSAPAGPVATREEYYQLGAGLAFYPGRLSRNPSAAGRTFAPLMPVATNGTFMVDTNVFQ